MGKKILGFRNMQEKLENHLIFLSEFFFVTKTNDLNLLLRVFEV